MSTSADLLQLGIACSSAASLAFFDTRLSLDDAEDAIAAMTLRKMLEPDLCQKQRVHTMAIVCARV